MLMSITVVSQEMCLKYVLDLETCIFVRLAGQKKS